MILEIDEITTIGELQRHFSASFPFLKLAVCKNVSMINDANKCIEIKDSDTLINTLRTKHREVFLEIHYWQKTGTIEKLFLHKAALHVQLLRKQGEHWIETSGTDELTLEEQNDIGRKATQELLHGMRRPVELEKPI